MKQWGLNRGGRLTFSELPDWMPAYFNFLISCVAENDCQLVSPNCLEQITIYPEMFIEDGSKREVVLFYYKHEELFKRFFQADEKKIEVNVPFEDEERDFLYLFSSFVPAKNEVRLLSERVRSTMNSFSKK